MSQSPHPVKEAAESPALDHLPFESIPIPIGDTGGVDLISVVDQIRSGSFSRLTNGVATPGSGVATRPGLTVAGTHSVVSPIHSLLRVNDPSTNPALNYYFTGMGNLLRWGPSGTPPSTIIGGGFSGDPLTFAVAADEFSHTPFVYIGDRSQMKKVNVRTGAPFPIGLAAPAEPLSLVASTPLTTNIAAFSASDQTDASHWHLGFLTLNGAVPTLSDVVGPSGSGGLLMVANPGTVSTSYVSYAFCRFTTPDGSHATRDLSLVGTAPATPRTATDDDIIHLWIKFNQPDHVKEVRIYFQCSPFSDAVPVVDKYPVPGMAPITGTPYDLAGVHGGAAYMRAFRPSDYTPFVAGTATGLEAASSIRTNDLLTGYSEPPVPTDVLHVSSQIAVPPGSTSWTELGRMDVPLRRSDFLKIGTAGDAGTDWSTISAIWIVLISNDGVAIDAAFDACYLTGGWDPDTSEPDATPYDYRLVNFDTITGARSNPSPVSTTTIDVLRQNVTITPAAAYGDANVRQEAYRRGGSLGSDWFFVSANAADGGPIIDTASDTLAATSGALEIDHDQPVTSVAADGSAIYGQAVRAIFGPIEGFLFACGDPNRPGTLYWSKRYEPDHWPAANHLETCPQSDELMNGAIYGAQGFVFSRERLYSIQVDIAGGNVLTLPTDCDKGIVSYTAFTTGLGGIYGVSRHDVFVTAAGGTPRVLSTLPISTGGGISPLFNGQTVNGYLPIDFHYLTAIRLALYGDDLWFGFQDTGGNRVWWVFSIFYQRWRFVQFGQPVWLVYPEPGDNTKRELVVGGTGKTYVHRGVTDDGTGITVDFRTNADVFGKPREEKLLGDVAVSAQMQGGTLTVAARLNDDIVVDAGIGVVGSTALDRCVFDLFGTVPQHASSLSLDLSWTTTGGMADLPFVDRITVDTAIQPAVTMNRATTWQPVNNVGEGFCLGCYIDADTGGTDRTILAEGLLNGAPVALATLTVNSNHGRRQWFSWPAQHVDMVRLRPTGACAAWMLFGQGWITDPEPPRISKWDSNEESGWDRYITGLDLIVNTFGQSKTVEVYVDGALVKTETFSTTAKQVHHITIPWVRGHILRFKATDDHIGLLYEHKWQTEDEPSEQTNFNQNYTVAGALSDKWLKGLVVELDTFGVDKQLQIEVDHVVVHTEIVNATNRRIVTIAFPEVRGRVFRLYPTDNVPGRLYTMAWLFDEEPLQLTRWETQEQPDSNIKDFYIAIDGQIAIRSTTDVTMTVTAFGQDGIALGGPHVYNLPSTNGVKSMISAHTFLTPQKGLLWKYVFSSNTGFWLYSEESWITFQPLSGGQPVRSAPFGNDDLDTAREMRDASLTATRAGGAIRSVA
jgi:hypothetical protein